jgi:hypothetical protein
MRLAMPTIASDAAPNRAAERENAGVDEREHDADERRRQPDAGEGGGADRRA